MSEFTEIQIIYELKLQHTNPFFPLSSQVLPYTRSHHSYPTLSSLHTTHAHIPYTHTPHTHSLTFRILYVLLLLNNTIGSHGTHYGNHTITQVNTCSFNCGLLSYWEHAVNGTRDTHAQLRWQRLHSWYKNCATYI